MLNTLSVSKDIVVDDNTSKISVGKYVQYFEDETRKLTINDVRNSKKFKHYKNDYIVL